MSKRKYRSSCIKSIDENRRKMIRDALGLAGMTTFAGLLSACGAPSGGDDTSGESPGPTSNEGPTNNGNPTNNGSLDVKFEAVAFILSSVAAPTTKIVNLSPGFGVPKGIIMVQSADRTDAPIFSGNGYNNGSFQIGFSDGTNDICIHAQHDSEATPGQDSYRTMYNNQISVRTQSTGNDGIRNRVSVSSFQPDQVILSIDEIDFPNGEDFECFLIAIGGSDVESVIVGHHDDLGTGTSAVPVIIGHEPDLIFTITDHDSSFNFKGENNRSADLGCNVSCGVAINDGRNSQMALAWSSPYGPRLDPAANTVGIYNDSIIASTADGAVENFSAAVTNFTANGVEVTPTASSSNCIFGYLSIKFAKFVDMAIVDTTIPTSGDISIANAGFNPGFGLWFNMNGPASYNTPTDTSFSLSMTVFDGNNIFTNMNNGLDGVTNTDRGAFARAHNAFQMLIPGGGNSIDVEASSYTFTNNGVAFSMTNWPANQVLGRMLLLGVN